MHGYKKRLIFTSMIKRLQANPSVALLGARQVGKSTLAEMLMDAFPNAIYLDLERPSDRNKLTNAEAFFQQFNDKMICLDEIQRAPELFAVLRGVIDKSMGSQINGVRL